MFRSIGIRGLAVWSAVMFAVLTVISLAALLGNAVVSERALQVVADSSGGAATADEIEVAALAYQRLSNLLLVAPNPEVAQARTELAAQVRDRVSAARRFIDDPQERRLVDRFEAHLDRYLTERDRVDAEHPTLDRAVLELGPAFAAVLSDLEALRSLNVRQTMDAQRRAQWSQRLAGVFSVVAAVILVVALVLVVVGVRRFVSMPVIDLHRAMEAFRGGDLSARGNLTGARELADLSRMFNDMADTLAQQRVAQLEFLAGVAHDLKNPLSTIRTGIYVLECERSAEKRGRMRLILDNQIDLMSRMLGDLLDANRIEAGHLELRCEEFDVRPLLKDLTRMYAVTAPGHHIVARVPARPVVIPADPLRLEQVVRNLLSNAIKYSPGGDVVVSLTVDGDRAQLAVTDQGAGIPTDERSSIFLPFRRRALNAAPGMGLGLSVARRIVAAHGGTIDVESVVGEGSTFRVTLPLAVPVTASALRLRG